MPVLTFHHIFAPYAISVPCSHPEATPRSRTGHRPALSWIDEVGAVYMPEMNALFMAVFIYLCQCIIHCPRAIYTRNQT